MYLKLFIILILSTVMQTNANIIRGILFDNETKAKIPYATVYFNSRSGTTTDMNGDFVLYVKNVKPNDTVWVSCIGYYRKTILWKELSCKTINKIFLTPVTYLLDTSVVSAAGITPFQLLRDAFKNIKINCNNFNHYYKASYYEQIKDYDHVKKWHTRTLNCAVIVEDPGYERLHSSTFGIIENVYILGINKGVDSITKVTFPERNLLTEVLENNYYHYSCKFLNSPKSYDYKITNTYYDSVIRKNMIKINISPKDAKKDVAYGEVYLSSSDHKIFKIHILYKGEETPDSTGYKNNYYTKYLDSDITVIYKLNKNDKMELSYIKYDSGFGAFYFENNNPYVVSIESMEFNVIGEVENGANLVKEIPKMDNHTRIYDQKVVSDTNFWLENNVILK